MKILEWGIYLVIFCLPMYLVRFSIFGLPTNVLEALVGVLFVVWVISQTRIKNYESGIKKIEKFIIPILLILIGVTVATIFSWDLRLSAGIWKGWFVVPIIFFLIVITSIKPEQIKKIFYSLIASGFIVSIISLVYLIQGNLDIHGRLQGIYNSPNFLAMYLAPIFIITFGYCFFTFLAAARGLLIVNCLLLIVVLFFTKSLGAWIGLLGAVLFGLLVCFYKKKNRKWFYTVLIMGIVIILLLSYFKIFILSEGGRSYDARILIWQRAWQAYKMNPVIGIGPGTFEYYFPPYPKWGVPQPHNLYLAFLLQTGIIGFIGFIWLLVWFFKKALSNKLSIINYQLLLLMAYILIHGLIDTTYWKNDLSMVFWLIPALLSIISRFSYSQTLNNLLAEKEINQ